MKMLVVGNDRLGSSRVSGPVLGVKTKEYPSEFVIMSESEMRLTLRFGI